MIDLLLSFYGHRFQSIETSFQNTTKATVYPTETMATCGLSSDLILCKIMLSV